MKKKSRLSAWKRNKETFPMLLDHPLDPEFEKFLQTRKSTKEKKGYSNLELTKLSKELIFDIKDGKPIIHVISPVLDTKKLELKYDNYLDIHYSGNEKEIEKEVVNTLGLAVALDVPIYPENDAVEKDLAHYYQKLIIDGFTAPDKEGKDVKLRPTNTKKIEDYKVENFTNVDLTKFWSPTDLLLLKDAVKNELLKLSNAHRTLTYLELAITEFEELLNQKQRNENKLQQVLTTYPILFGLEYSRVIPKHKLGSEFEVDYALEKYSGLIDLMEIESSNLPLFTKGGNPSNYLVHAEQQVIDWLDWVEKNGAYARSKAEGLITPKAFVVIGRRFSLNEKTKASLIRRNKAFNGVINILTYDDVLNNAKSILKLLKKEN
jgi:hypothetical protein